jgi:multicomponent Na+:H+ antiporter subunit E
MTRRHSPAFPQAAGATPSPESAARPPARALLARGTGLFGFWLLLSGPRILEGWTADASTTLIVELLVGLLATVAATWTSLRLLPCTPGRLHLGALVKLIVNFLWQSIVAGVDVARRAFDPRLPLRPGLVSYPVGIPAGTGRAAFGALTSLMPGTVPVGTDPDGALVYHCLDLDQPIATALARDEALMVRTKGEIVG